MNKDNNIISEEYNTSYIGVRPDILSLIRPDIKNLLDIGCSNGTLGLSIKNKYKSLEITGIEFDINMASIAEQKLDKVYVANLNNINIIELLANKKFDCIIMADILEHLINPWEFIKQITNLLADNGMIITSIPNVRHISTILTLIFKGEWPYRKRGIHDITHLRFFTRSNIIDMFNKAGLKIIKEKRNMRIVEHPSRINVIAKLFDIWGLREFFTFQYLYKCILIEKNKVVINK